MMMSLILGIVLLVFAIGLVDKIFKPLDEEIITKNCWESVLFNAERRVPGIEAQTVAVKCPTKYITIHMQGSKQEYEESPSTENEPFKLPDIQFKDEDKKACEDSDDEDACIFRNVNKVMADEIVRCWNNFHRGQKRVFSLYKPDQTQCVVCSVILFDSEMVEEYGEIGPIGFQQPEDEHYSLDLYMRNNNNLKYTGEENYYKYSLDLVDEYFDLPYYDYSTNTEYAVVFAALNKERISGMTDNAWEIIKAAFTNYVPPEEEEGNFINTLHFIPNEEVPLTCDTWG